MKYLALPALLSAILLAMADLGLAEFWVFTPASDKPLWAFLLMPDLAVLAFFALLPAAIMPRSLLQSLGAVAFAAPAGICLAICGVLLFHPGTSIGLDGFAEELLGQLGDVWLACLLALACGAVWRRFRRGKNELHGLSAGV